MYNNDSALAEYLRIVLSQLVEYGFVYGSSEWKVSIGPTIKVVVSDKYNIRMRIPRHNVNICAVCGRRIGRKSKYFHYVDLNLTVKHLIVKEAIYHISGKHDIFTTVVDNPLYTPEGVEWLEKFAIYKEKGKSAEESTIQGSQASPPGEGSSSGQASSGA